MALFYKHPAKKPDPNASQRASGRAPSARELAAAHRQGAEPLAEPTGSASAKGASIVDWARAQGSIEVQQTNPGLCAVLENAALLFASGQVDQARSILEHGVQSDHDTKLSPLAWLALFDLLQRANDRAAFEQLAMQYIVQFERSAPAWDDRVAPARTGDVKKGGFITITGKLSGASTAQLLGLRRAIDSRVARARLDLSSAISFDDGGARALATHLAEARKAKMELVLERPENLRMALDAAVRKGKDGGQGAWLLLLELLQWQHEQAAFDDRAVDYAVAFEVSPPSWEPPAHSAPATPPAPTHAADEQPADADTDALTWSGVLAGANTPQVAGLVDFAHRRNLIVVDLTPVERIDFVCAGALLNAINRVESQRKTVQLVGASPIVRALLLLIGISPRHFVKKAA